MAFAICLGIWSWLLIAVIRDDEAFLTNYGAALFGLSIAIACISFAYTDGYYATLD